LKYIQLNTQYLVNLKPKIDKKEMTQKVKTFKFNQKKWENFFKEIQNEEKIPSVNLLLRLEQIFFYQLFHAYTSKVMEDQDLGR
jgi:uncharacterized protein with NAD-binding domain and iron-sulfur cluster